MLLLSAALLDLPMCPVQGARAGAKIATESEGAAGSRQTLSSSRRENGAAENGPIIRRQ